MLTREKPSDYLETRASQDSDIPIVVAPAPHDVESSSVPLGRYPLAIRVDSNEIGDDQSSSGLSTPIINTYDFDQPETYEPDCIPISESPKSVEENDTWTYPKSLITRNSIEDSTPDLPGGLIGQRAISEYYNFLYGTATEMDPKVAVSLEEHYFWTYTSRTLRRRPFPRPKEYINLLNLFINFWTKTKGPWTVSNFCVYLGTLGQDPGTEPETIGSVVAESLLLQALSFGQDLEQDLGQALEELFPAGNAAERDIHIQLGDILGAGFDIEPVDQIERHLDINGRTVSIFRPNPQDMPIWLQYEHNKIARALGLSSLWLETIATLRDLYGNKPDLTRVAVTRNLYPSEADGNTHAFTAALTTHVPRPKLNLLAGKLEKLEAKIAEDNVWW